MDFIARLEVSKDQATWRGDEVPWLTANALCPVPDGPPLHVTDLLRIVHRDGKEVHEQLATAERETLDRHWAACGLPPVQEPMTAEQWVPYLLAFNEEPKRPEWADWMLAVLPPKDPNLNARIARAIAVDEHRKRLRRALDEHEIAARMPGSMTEAPASANLQNVVLTKAELRKFAAMLCIEVVEERHSVAQEHDPLPGVAWLTWEEAENWLHETTGEQWPPPRILSSGVRIGVWLEPRPDQSEGEIEHIFQGRWQGFMAEVFDGYDRERLQSERVEGVITLTKRPDGTVLRFTPPLKFAAVDAKILAADLKRLVVVVGQGIYPEKAQPVVGLRVGGAELRPDDPGFAAWLALHGGPESLVGAKVELLRFMPLPVNERTVSQAEPAGTSVSDTPLRFPLAETLQPWIAMQLQDVPANLRAAVQRAIYPLAWDDLTPAQRASWAAQFDAQYDPANEGERQRWWQYWTKRDELLRERAAIEAMKPDRPSEHVTRREELARIQDELAELESQHLVGGQSGLGRSAAVDDVSGRSSVVPVSRQEAQEVTILAKLRELNFDPKRLPRSEPGKPGPKAQVKRALGAKGMWSGAKVFDKAWERLRRAGEIADAR